MRTCRTRCHPRSPDFVPTVGIVSLTARPYGMFGCADRPSGDMTKEKPVAPSHSHIHHNTVLPCDRINVSQARLTKMTSHQLPARGRSSYITERLSLDMESRVQLSVALDPISLGKLDTTRQSTVEQIPPIHIR
jgi:hypothetical protein